VQRAAALAVAFSVASFPFLLPHVVEDFHWGIGERAGLPADVMAALLGVGLLLQVLGLVLAGRGDRAGLGIVAAAGALWTLGALWDHGLPLLLFGLGFRGRALSALWVTGLIVTQALAAGSALAALGRAPRGR
jgi:hypothetical protein